QIADGGFRAGVLQVHAEDSLAFLVLGLEVGDVALFLEDAGNLGLQLRSRYIQLLVAGTDRIPDARQKIGYWISQTHSFSFIPRSLAIFENQSGMVTTEGM